MLKLARCTTLDLAEVIGECDPLYWTQVHRQLRESIAWAARDRRGRAVACAGVHLDPPANEAWLIVRRPARAYWRDLVRLIRLTACDVRLALPPVVTLWPHTEHGRRIARQIGFVDTAEGAMTWATSSDQSSEAAHRMTPALAMRKLPRSAASSPSSPPATRTSTAKRPAGRRAAKAARFSNSAKR